MKRVIDWLVVGLILIGVWIVLVAVFTYFFP